MPRLHIDDRFHILDEHARTIVVADVSVHDAHAELEEILADHKNADTSMEILEFWDRARVQSHSPTHGRAAFTRGTGSSLSNRAMPTPTPNCSPRRCGAAGPPPRSP